jgi:hypothetical protein
MEQAALDPAALDETQGQDRFVGKVGSAIAVVDSRADGKLTEL